IVHADETGWRISRLNAWLWVFSSATLTVYAIRTSRGHEVPEEILGKEFDGLLIVDGWSAYDVLGCDKGRCNAHVLRRCKDLIEQGASAADARHLDGLIALRRRGLKLAERYEEMGEADYWAQVEVWEEDWLDWLGQIRRAGGEV